MSTADAMRAALAALDPAAIEIDDDSHKHKGHAGARGGGGHYRLLVVSPRFAGLSTMQRHRMVYDSLAPLMQSEIHAVSITARTPDETR